MKQLNSAKTIQFTVNVAEVYLHFALIANSIICANPYPSFRKFTEMGWVGSWPSILGPEPAACGKLVGSVSIRVGSREGK